MLADRLRAMAPALKTLQHPNIAAFFELVTVGADLALFLEYVPGASLDKVRQPAGRLDINVSVSCAVQVLRALECAHGAGVLHHALRPGNVRVTRQGTVKVLDFGIGHAFGANRKTREDRLLTVLAYLAPEQIQNQPGDARSDIYAAGVLLYELLTGRLPFDHKTEFALRQAHLAEPPAAPRTIVPGLPDWLDQAVLRALAKNPASRYQNATEFRAVLEAALGLSTSREAAIVRQRDGASVETFAAAPPIPPPPPARQDGAAAGRDSHVRKAQPSRPSGVETGETVVAGSPVRSADTDTVAATAAGPGPMPATGATRSAAPPAAAHRARARNTAVVAASILVVVALAGTVAYLWMRSPAPPPSSGVTPVVEQAGAHESQPAAAEAPSAATAPSETNVPPPAVAPPPAVSASAAPAPAAAPSSPDRKTPPKPATGQKPAAAAPVVIAGSAATTPPGEPAAPAAALPVPKAEKTPDVSYRKVKLITQAGSSEKSTDVALVFSDDRLSVTPAGGGAALRTVRYAEIAAASYSKAQKKRLGFIKSAQHLLEVDTGGEPLLLRLDNDNVEPILAALEARSGRAVSR
jgi:hypothetical protein